MMNVIGYAIFYKNEAGEANYVDISDPEMIDETMVMLTDNGATETLVIPIVDVQTVMVPGS